MTPGLIQHLASSLLGIQKLRVRIDLWILKFIGRACEARAPFPAKMLPEDDPIGKNATRGRKNT